MRHKIPLRRHRARQGRHAQQDELVAAISTALSNGPIPKRDNETLLGRLGQGLANWSQVVMVGVVAWGYFYTVIPVFQKEKISEDLARLEIEKASWQREIDRHKEQVSESKRDIERLNRTRSDLAKVVTRLHAESSAARARIKSSEEELSRAREQLDTTRASLTKTESRLYEVQKLEILGRGPMPVEHVALLNNTISSFDIFKRGNESSVAENLKTSYIQPSVMIEEKVQELEHRMVRPLSDASKNAEGRLVEEYKKGLGENSHLLHCPEPNFHEWQNAYLNALSIGEKMHDECIFRHSRKRNPDEDWASSDLEKIMSSDSWNEQRRLYSVSCETSIRGSVEKTFREKWKFVYEPCQQRLQNLSAIALSDKEVAELLPFRDLSPPTEAEVRSEVRSMIVNWIKLLGEKPSVGEKR